jgi:Glycosyltransferase family 87
MAAVRGPRDSIEYLRAAITVVLAIAALLWLTLVYWFSSSVLVALHYNDFGKFYYAVVQARQGQSLYAPNVATLIPLSKTVSRQFWDLNPPHFHLLVWPLAYLPVRQAYIAWTAFNVALAGVSLAAVRAELSLRFSRRTYFVSALVLLAAAPTVAWFVTGQLTGILAALGTWIWIELRRQRWGRAGIAVGLACGLKPFLAPLIVYLALRRHWTAVAAATAATCVCFAAGVLVFGLGAHREWLAVLRDVRWTWAAMNASVVAPLARVTVPAAQLTDASTPSVSLTIAATGISVTVLLVGLWAAIRTRSVDRSVCILYLTCLLSSPLGWVYYHWIMIGPGLATFRQHDRRWVYAACAGLLVPFFLLAFLSVALAVTVGSLYTWSTLLLWMIAVRGAATPQRSRSSSGTAPELHL